MAIAGGRKRGVGQAIERIAAGAVAFVTLVGFVGFGAGPAAAAWRQDRFLVGGWLPGPSQDAAELLRLADLGLDYFHAHLPYAAENRIVAARLDSLRAARPGFRLLYVAHTRVPFDDPSRIVDNDDPARNWPRIRPTVERGGGLNVASTLGWHLADEPVGSAAMARIAEMTRRLRALPATSGQLPYCNLLPLIEPAAIPAYAAAYGRDPARAYAAYLRDYLGRFDGDPDPAPVLSFDHYPFQASARPGPYWFLNLALVRDAAREHSRPAEGRFIPIWVAIQASPARLRGDAAFRAFTPVMLRWQAWSAIAYGAKGLAYWTLSPAEDTINHLGFGAGVFDGRGRRTALYAAVRALDAQVHALGPTLMRLEPVAARHVTAGGQEGIAVELWGTGAGPLGPVSAVAAAPGRADALVTLFRADDSGESYVFVFNKSVAAGRSFGLRLVDPAARIERVRRADGRLEAVTVRAGTFGTGPLGPGEGNLFRVRAAAR